MLSAEYSMQVKMKESLFGILPKCVDDGTLDKIRNFCVTISFCSTNGDLIVE